MSKWWSYHGPSSFERSLESFTLSGRAAPSFSWHPALAQFAINLQDDSVAIGEVCEVPPHTILALNQRSQRVQVPPGEAAWLRLTLSHDKMTDIRDVQYNPVGGQQIVVACSAGVALWTFTPTTIQSSTSTAKAASSSASASTATTSTSMSTSFSLLPTASPSISSSSSSSSSSSTAGRYGLRSSFAASPSIASVNTNNFTSSSSSSASLLGSASSSSSSASTSISGSISASPAHTRPNGAWLAWLSTPQTKVLGPVTCARFSPCGRYIATCFEASPCVAIWDVATAMASAVARTGATSDYADDRTAGTDGCGDALTMLTRPFESAVREVSWSPSHAFLLLTLRTGSFVLMETSTWTTDVFDTADDRPIAAFAWSSDDSALVFATEESAIVHALTLRPAHSHPVRTQTSVQSLANVRAELQSLFASASANGMATTVATAPPKRRPRYESVTLSGASLLQSSSYTDGGAAASFATSSSVVLNLLASSPSSSTSSTSSSLAGGAGQFATPGRIGPASTIPVDFGANPVDYSKLCIDSLVWSPTGDRLAVTLRTRTNKNSATTTTASASSSSSTSSSTAATPERVASVVAQSAPGSELILLFDTPPDMAVRLHPIGCIRGPPSRPHPLTSVSFSSLATPAALRAPVSGRGLRHAAGLGVGSTVRPRRTTRVRPNNSLDDVDDTAGVDDVDEYSNSNYDNVGMFGGDDVGSVARNLRASLATMDPLPESTPARSYVSRGTRNQAPQASPSVLSASSNIEGKSGSDTASSGAPLLNRPLRVSFHPRCDRGALMSVVWASEFITYYPLYFKHGV